MTVSGNGIGLGIGVGTLATSYSVAGIYTGASGELFVLTKTAQPIYFYTADTERAQITANGFFKASNTGSYASGGVQCHEMANNSAEFITKLYNANSAPLGMIINYSAAAPNTGSAGFLYGSDNVATRFYFASNGGLANYSANNTNLSDADVKAEITPYDDKELDALENSFKSVQWCKFKYTDQTHRDWNHGYTAQMIEKAFAATAPELVDETDIGTSGEGIKHKAVYDADLTHIALALLARALKRIEALEAKLSSAPGGKHRHS